MKITDKDIATIEALHDLLLDENITTFKSACLVRARELTRRMYIELEYKSK